MSTVFYCFENQTAYVKAGGKTEAEHVSDGVSFSVIGDYYAQPPEVIPEDFTPEYIGYLVNASQEIEGWEEMICHPVSPLRIFG